MAAATVVLVGAASLLLIPTLVLLGECLLAAISGPRKQPPPEGGAVPNDPPDVQLLANGQVFWKNGGSAFDYFFRKIAVVEIELSFAD